MRFEKLQLKNVNISTKFSHTIIMKNYLKTLIKNFITCGFVGWCVEIMFTSFHSFRRRDLSLKGTTSIWMFPIYGMASTLALIYRPIKNKCTLFRGCIYTCLIFLTEFTTGKFLRKHNVCPWDYSRCRYHIGKVIRLDYIPCWFGVGLLFEWILSRKSRNKTRQHKNFKN